MKKTYNLSVEEAYAEYNTNETGLTSNEANDRLLKYGKNALAEQKPKTLLQRFFAQLKDLMIIILLVASLISAVIAVAEGVYEDLLDAGVILIIVILNAVIGVIQEAKADDALKKLTNINKPFAKVYRDGEVVKIKSEDIVVGDIVLLEAGDIVPADIRLTSSNSLKIQESALTGESVPSEKNYDVVLEDTTPIGDQSNMAFSSGIVTYGRGSGVVVATGMQTQVGKIANMLNTEQKTNSPLQKQIAKTAKVLTYVVLGIALFIFAFGIITKSPNQSLMDSIISNFMMAITIAVAAIPEGLPAVVTIVLALGVKKMSEKKAIVKNLPSVETLGCCEVICSDKTGTLTLNQMTVEQAYTLNSGIYLNSTKLTNFDNDLLIKGMTLCNDTKESKNKLIGDPTETALVAYAKSQNYKPKQLLKDHERIFEIPFDSDRKLMTTVHNYQNQKISFTKGALDILLNKCVKILDGEVCRDITPNDLKQIKDASKQMASSALRVLALAYKTENLDNFENLENNLVLVGFVGMIDPPRAEVIDAVKTCKKAGMSAVMITGDHLDTAVAIASKIGIYTKGDLAITGAELDKLSDEEFLQNLRKYKVYARVSPENKVRIVKAYKKINVIVAMTGDGVNDAPSIKSADIGIGMGITGTDVSKGVADIVLADDNFATIVLAVEEGRKIYSNIKKAVQYLLSANIAEVLCLFIASIFLRTQFLTSIMILWINLVTDSFPALSLGMEKGEKDIMNYPPRKANSSLFAGETGINILIQGFFQTALTLTAFCIGAYVLTDGILNHTVAMTMAFLTLALIQLFHSYNLRSQTHSLFSRNPFANKSLNIAFLVGIALIAITFVPALQSFFGTTSLTLTELLISVGCAIAIIPLVELQKIIMRIIKKNK